jgi:hypothetical protein
VFLAERPALEAALLGVVELFGVLGADGLVDSVENSQGLGMV